MDEDEIRRRVEKTTILEAQFKEQAAGRKAEEKRAAEKKPEEKRPEEKRAEERRPEEKAPASRPADERKTVKPPFRGDVLEGEKISTADIFAETDIIPFVSSEPGERAYGDLRGLAAEELGWLAAARASQLAGESSPLERALTTIVAEFRKDLCDKGGPVDAEARFQLGLAFMGQGLTAEAVEELTQAAQDKSLALACYSLIGQGFRQKRNLEEAAKWFERAMAEAKPASDQHFALAYELAEVLEASDEGDRAAALFREVCAWNPGYRNVSGRLERFAKSAAG
jgi:tetratricopeptide (TPR) repeat protein